MTPSLPGRNALSQYSQPLLIAIFKMEHKIFLSSV